MTIEYGTLLALKSCLVETLNAHGVFLVSMWSLIRHEAVDN